MAATKNYAGALAVRFFSGVFEAAVTPGFALFPSQVGLYPVGVTTSIRYVPAVYEKGAEQPDSYLVVVRFQIHITQ
jgi:hypothetical protein